MFQTAFYVGDPSHSSCFIAFQKSSNPFAALDDSGDEAPKAKAPAKKSSSKTVAPASKPDPKSKPKNNDRNTKHGRGGRVARDGKRAYDRRSGTGRGKEIKKVCFERSIIYTSISVQHSILT